MNWINTKEKLPEDTREVLTYKKDEKLGLDWYVIGRYDPADNSWMESHECIYLFDISHWAELTAPNEENTLKRSPRNV